jgi:malonyl-CoA/methylmalonyl-CoA synthetase
MRVDEPKGWEAHLDPRAGGGFDPTAGGLESLCVSWVAKWRENPARKVIHDPDTGWLDGAALDERSARAAGRLAALGVAPGDRVLLSAEASADLVVAHVACLRLGAVVVPTNTAYRDAELAHIVGDAAPRAAIVDADSRAAALHRADPALRIVSPAVEAPDAAPPSLDAAARETPALLGYTSGTTGRPKGAVLSHGNLLASCEALREAWRWTPGDRLVLCLPLFHMHGLGVGLHGTLHAGGSALLQRGFAPDDVFEAIRGHDATLFFGVPTMYHRLVASPDVALLGRLRLCVSGSAPLPAALHQRFEAQTGQRILERYGMTETVMLVSNPCDGERRPGTVGLPLPGVELRLHGNPGEIQVRGPNVFGGYWQRPEANAEAFTADGWFRTGDLGERDDAGYVRISGRAKELLLSGGFNVYPREVEDAVREHPDIEDVAVVGTPDDEWGEVVTAYIVARQAIEVAELRAWLGDRLAAYKHPRVLWRVEQLPRNALGKVQKHRLAGGRVLPVDA